MLENVAFELGTLLEGTHYNYENLFCVIPFSLSSARVSVGPVSSFLCAKKKDGIFYKLISCGSVVYLVSRTYVITKIADDFPLVEKKYILDVELVGDNIFILDIMYITGLNYSFGRRYNIMNIIVQKVPKVGIYNLHSQLFKPFQCFNEVDLVSSEGLIFLKMTEYYDNSILFKWKTFSNNTVDYNVINGEVFLKDFKCGNTLKEDGLYSVDVDTYVGKLRTDKSTSNSYEVALSVISTSLILYTQLESVFIKGFSANFHEVERKFRAVQLYFFCCEDADKKIAAKIPVVIPELEVLVDPVFVVVKHDLCTSQKYNVRQLEYKKKDDIIEDVKVTWFPSVYASLEPYVQNKDLIYNRYKVTGIDYSKNYFSSRFDKINTRSIPCLRSDHHRSLAYRSSRVVSYKKKVVFRNRVSDRYNKKRKKLRSRYVIVQPVKNKSESLLISKETKKYEKTKKIT